MKLLIVAPPHVTANDIEIAVLKSPYKALEEIVIGDHNRPVDAWAEFHDFQVCHMNSRNGDLETLAKRMVAYADAAVIVCDCDDELVYHVYNEVLATGLPYFLKHGDVVKISSPSL